MTKEKKEETCYKCKDPLDLKDHGKESKRVHLYSCNKCGAFTYSDEHDMGWRDIHIPPDTRIYSYPAYDEQAARIII